MEVISINKYCKGLQQIYDDKFIIFGWKNEECSLTCNTNGAQHNIYTGKEIDDVLDLIIGDSNYIIDYTGLEVAKTECKIDSNIIEFIDSDMTIVVTGYKYAGNSYQFFDNDKYNLIKSHIIKS
ncbi:Hypothetical protein ORPV_1185 [Orpheovirus IHUMI-LCC2]|uniref:Uncharacterized protein n=1 Tax=Orpheovirus IHUMI-LCC2 TaxID=2023057 RepID=A0A2I2L6I4_9VIRU|nr:Hypothetical protein ORPV_1185 [Orpheovirus IHUMI-LCC2]SNW63089.1 Hypothetical protein ORPV_1185 [Orpheovirus IHUMI-LCC2]